MKTLSEAEFNKRYGLSGKSAQPSKSTFGQRLKQAASQGVKKIGEAGKDINSGNPLRFIEGSLKLGAGAVETAFSPITAATEPVVAPTLGRAVNYAADKISDNPKFQKFATSKGGEITSRVLEDVNNLNTIASAVAGPKVAQRTGTSVSKTVGGVGSSINKSLGKLPSTSLSGTGVMKTLRGAKDIASIAIEEGRRIPNRIAINTAERQGVQAAINKLPTPIAKRAAQDGLDIGDIQTLYSIPKTQRAPLKELAEVVQKFAKGETKTNPIEVVGKPIVARLKELERARMSVGSKLGNLAKNLGVVTKEETLPTIFGRLKKVPGLEGLTINDKGSLNFKNTVLTTAETVSDRKAIQSIFDSATKWGSGTKKHLLRQELFESLGGKKRASLNLTATQERAYQAVREGLSDVLESKSPFYKRLSSQYRQIIKPLEDMRKLMKVAGETDDIMNMSAGLLARRLTSAASSNPQIRAIITALDKATPTTGKTRLSVEALQDFYNILDKYYDITPKTGFQAQVRQGVEKAASGPLDYVAEQIKGFAGETPAVRQKALENILKEILA